MIDVQAVVTIAHRKLRRGNWRPGRTNWALFVIEVGAAWSALVRGFDYFRSAAEPETTILTLVQDSPSLPTWGLAFIAGGLLIFAGMVCRWGRMVAIGHMIAMAAYTSAGWAALQVVGLGPGLRLANGLFYGALINGVLGFFIFGILRQREELADRAEP